MQRGVLPVGHRKTFAYSDGRSSAVYHEFALEHTGMPRKRRPCDQPRKCVTCGKTLPAGVRYCVSCGTHDETELDTRVADVDVQLERSRHEHSVMLRFLSYISFGFWRL